MSENFENLLPPDVTAHGVKVEIVRQLACYATNAEVREYIEENYGTQVSAAYVSRHHPANKTSAGMGQELIDLFWETRDQFQRGLDDCGIVYRAYRLRKLDEMCRKAIDTKNFSLAAQLMEQAAKEMGGAFESRKNQGAITLETLQTAIDKLAAVVVREVKDPEVLRRIDEAWGTEGVGTDRASKRKENDWG